MPKTSIVKLNKVENDKMPLFMTHPIDGNCECLRFLASLLPCPVYGIQMTLESPFRDLKTVAEFYIQKIKLIQSTGPYRLAGYSAGSLIAMEMANQLQGAKDTVQSLILLDGAPDMVAFFAEYADNLNRNSVQDMQAFQIAMFLKLFIDLDDIEKVCKAIMKFGALRQCKYATNMLMKTGIFLSRDELEKFALCYFDLTSVISVPVEFTYNGDVTLIKANLSMLCPMEKDYGLKKIVSGKLSVNEVRGDHETFIFGIGGRQCAEIMTPLLS